MASLESGQPAQTAGGLLGPVDLTLEKVVKDFENPALGGRRLFSELFGTFFLVLVAAGGPVVNAASGGKIPLSAQVIAPGLMVMAMILFMGAVSGAHFNPVVSLAFALRGDFPWGRVVPYITAQLIGSVLAAQFLRMCFGKIGSLGATLPGPGVSVGVATVMEAVLTLGLLSTILGVSSGAQNLGPLSALGVGAYIALAGMWSAPISGASMNPVRSLGPVIVSGNWHAAWAYIVGPAIGGLLAVGVAWILRGRGGGRVERKAAQGAFNLGLGTPRPAHR